MENNNNNSTISDNNVKLKDDFEPIIIYDNFFKDNSIKNEDGALSNNFSKINENEINNDFLESIIDAYNLRNFNYYFEEIADKNINEDNLLQRRKDILNNLRNKLVFINKILKIEYEELDIKLDEEVFNVNKSLIKEKIAETLTNMFPKDKSFFITSKIYKKFLDSNTQISENLLEELNIDLYSYLKNEKIRTEAFKHINKIFNNLDIDGSGTITIDNLKDTYKLMGLPKEMADNLIAKIKNSIKTKNDDKISRSEFEIYFKEKVLRNYEIFYNLDKDKNGELTYQQAKNSILELYPNISLDENIFNKLITTMDTNKSGKIDFEEWSSFIILFGEKNFEHLVNRWKLVLSLSSSENVNFFELDIDYDQGNDFNDFIKWCKVFFSGMISGAISRTVTAPLESMKVLFQTDYLKANKLVDGLIEVYQKLGIRKFFKGNSLAITFNTLEQASRFCIIEYTKNNFEKSVDKNLSAFHFFKIGIIASFCASTILFPIEHLRIRFIASEEKKIKNKMLEIYKAGGIKGFFSGYSAYMLTVMPAGSMNVMFYNLVRRVFTSDKDKYNANIFKFSFLGGLGAFITNTVVYPFNVIANRTIVAKKNEKNKTVSIFSMSKTIKNENGVRGFYKGYTFNILRVTLGQAINFGTFEYLRCHLVGHGKKQDYKTIVNRMNNDSFVAYDFKKSDF